MTSLMIDDNNNLVFGNDLFIVKGLEALKQDIRTRLGMFKGENPLNLNDGVPYVEMLKSGNRNLFKSTLRNECLKDNRLKNAEVSIESFKNDTMILKVECLSIDNKEFIL